MRRLRQEACRADGMPRAAADVPTNVEIPPLLHPRLRSVLIPLAVTLAGLAGPRFAVAAEWDADAQAGIGYDSNLGRAASAEDRRADAAILASASAGAAQQAGTADRVRAGLGVSAELRTRFTGLTEVDVTGTAQWRHKFGLGLTATWAMLAASATRIDSHDPIRDGERYLVEFSVGRRVDERFQVGAATGWERRRAGDFPLVPGISGATFDLVAWNASVNASYAPDDAWLLGGQYDVRRGDVVSVSQRGPAIFFASSAIAEDPALGPELYAYRLRGTSQTPSAYASYALDDHASINLSYAFEYTRSAAALNYRTHLASFTYAYRY